MDSLSRNLPPLRALLAFEAAARHGSFTRAAYELNVSQPAVSRQVRALEGALATPLFYRGHRRVTLTSAGQKYFEAIGHCFNGILAAGRNIAQTGTSQRLTVYANYGLASYWLMPRLAKFQIEHPEIEVAVSTVEEERDLSDTETEIAIRFGNGRWHDGETRLLFSEVGFPVCSPGYLETAQPLCSAHDLGQHRLLQIRASQQPWLDWATLLKALQVNSSKCSGPSYNNYTLAIQAALAGQGVAIGWKHIVDEFLKQGWLINPLGVEVATEFGYYSVANDLAQHSDNARIVLDCLHR